MVWFVGGFHLQNTRQSMNALETPKPSKNPGIPTNKCITINMKGLSLGFLLEFVSYANLCDTERVY